MSRTVLQACLLTLQVKLLVQKMGQELPPLIHLLSMACSLQPEALEHLLCLIHYFSQKLQLVHRQSYHPPILIHA